MNLFTSPVKERKFSKSPRSGDYKERAITGVMAIVWSQLWEHLDHRSVLEEPVKVL
jgi:hypothetical protein